MLMSASTLDKAYWRLKQGKPEEAIPLLEELIQRLPVYVTPHVLLAWAYESKEEWNKATETWQRAYFLMPNSAAVREGMQRAMKTVAEQPSRVSSSPSAALEFELPSPQAPAPPETPPPAPSEDDSEPPEDQDALSDSLPRPQRPSRPHSPNDLLTDITDTPLESTRGAAEFEDLDRLIDDLEAARIQPQPDLDDIPEPDLDNQIEDVVSETLAQIYVGQEQFGEAARVYTKLAEQDPSRAEEFLKKAEEMRQRAEENNSS